jgi:thiol-disulfide isomerase/thioredoxin
MKTVKAVVLVVFIVSLSSPLVAQASWWNPLSWFKKSTVEQPHVVPVVNTEHKEGDTKKPITTSHVPPKGSIKVKLGEKYEAQGASAMVTEVVEDSRCPTDVQCIQAGTVKIKVKAFYKILSKTITMTLGQPFSYKGYSATLVDVLPTPTSSTKINPSDYVFYFSLKTPTVVEVAPKQEESYLAKVAQCLKDNGAQFFGASWCPHCQAQKLLFGVAAELLPYVECSPDPTKPSQAQICIDNKITAYPTWKFKSGEVISGEQTIEALAAKAHCSIIK